MDCPFNAVNREKPVAIEIEAKFRIDSPERLRVLLRKLGATTTGVVLETNRLFDTPDGLLRDSDRGLRIREFCPLGDQAASHPPGLLTYKGPRAAGEFKSREECETPIAAPRALAEILAHLGYQETVVYQKRREAWRLGASEIALDELPKLGWFVEIEAPAVESVEQTRAQLGLSDTPLCQQTYAELAATHGNTSTNNTPQLLFP